MAGDALQPQHSAISLYGNPPRRRDTRHSAGPTEVVRTNSVCSACGIADVVSLWVLEEGLRRFDPHKAYLEDLPLFPNTTVQPKDNEAIRLQKERQVAFEQDAKNLDLNPAYWKTYIEQRRAIREMELKIAKTGKRKRAPHKHHDHNSLQEVDVFGPSVSPPKKQNHVKKVRGLKGVHLPTPGSTPIKPKPCRSQSTMSQSSKGAVSDEDDLFVGPRENPSDQSTSECADSELQKLRRGDESQTQGRLIRQVMGTAIYS